MTDFIIKYRKNIIAICLVLGFSFACLIPFSKTDPEIRNYIPQSMKSRKDTDKIEKEFGVQDMVVLLFRDSLIMTPSDLKRIRECDRDISKLGSVTSRTSLFTVRSIKNEDGMMKVNPLVQKIPSDSAGLSQLRKEISLNRFARNTVVSSDMTSASISATINTSVKESVTLQKIDSVIASHPGKAKVLKGGLPFIRQHIMKDVRKDAVILVPLALLIMFIVLKLTLGEWKSVLMPFTVVLLSASISMGLIPLLGWKLSIITLLVPVLLISVANNYGIYLVERFQGLCSQKENKTKGQILKELTGSLNMPILFSGLTTIAGILGLLAHSIIPARQVGALAAIGISVALAMSLILIPALIYMRGNAVYGTEIARAERRKFSRFLGKLSDIIIRNPGRVISISLIITILVSTGMFLLRIETNQEKYFPKKNPLSQASAIINEKFGGSQTISVMITGDIRDPAIMNGIDNLTRQIEPIDGVGQVFSISQAVREMSKALFVPGDDGYDQIPKTREGIAQMFELYNMSGDPSDFSQLMNLDNSKAHLLIKLSNPENSVIVKVKEKIAYISKSIPAEVTIGGYAVIMSDFARSIIKGQVMSIIFALIIVFILLTIIFRSMQGGLVSSIPLAVSILILFGFMGYAGIALDSATALLSSIMIGVGVDFTIQYIWCFNIQIKNGLSHEDSTRAALCTIGRSIMINAFSVMAGFSALIFSGFTSIRFFGYLVIISIGTCLLGAIVLIPAILLYFRPGFVEKDMNKSKTKQYEKDKELIDVPAAAFAGIGTAAGCGSGIE